MQASSAAPLPRCPRAIAERHGLARRPEPRLKPTGARNPCLRCERTGLGHGARRRATGIPPRRARARGRCRRPPRRVAGAPGLAAAPRRPAQAASRPARAPSAGTLDDLVATALSDVLPHSMGNGFVQPAALARRRRRFAGGGGDEPERRRRATMPMSTSSAPWCAGWPSSSAFRTRRAPACSRAARPPRRSSASRALAALRWRPLATTCAETASPAPRSSSLDAAALRASIAADRASGAQPALLVGSAGTVNAGSIDPLADVATAEGLCSTSTAPMAHSACSTQRSQPASAAWSGPTR